MILEFSGYLKLIRRNWIGIAACTFLAVLITGIGSLFLKQVYTAETQLFVAIQNSGSVSELQQGNTFGQARVQSYVKTVSTPRVLQPAIDSLGLNVSAARLAKDITATADANTVLITITARSESPAEAAGIAKAVGDSLVMAVDELESPTEGGTSAVKLSVLTPAVAPNTPSSPNVPLNLLLGLLLGLGVGVGLAVLRASFDTKVRGESDVRRITDSPVLGGIAFDEDATKKPLLTQAAHQSPRAESFRQIRTNLQFAHVGHKSKALLVTSSLPGEGKSTTAINLAIAMAQAGQLVALVDADLRRPMVGEYLGLERNAGLTTALIGQSDVNSLLQAWGEDELYVLTSGQLPPNPSELLGSEAMKSLIDTLEQSFDAVIIDAPPLLPVTDAAVLAQQVGGVVLVVGSQKVKIPELERATAALRMVEADLLGVVLNRLPSKGADAYAYSYYSYKTPSPSDRGTRSGAVRSSITSPDPTGAFDAAILSGRTREPARFRGKRSD
jgi:capsular exopolysaccharide synthesis family protein